MSTSRSHHETPELHEERHPLLEVRINALVEKTSVLEGKIESFAEAEKRKSWYKDPGTLISLVALALSGFAFAYFTFREINKDRDQRRDDLQAAIVQLNTLSTQWGEAYVKYKDDPNYYSFLNPAMRMQMSLIGGKAYTLLQELGNEASALDAAVVANALQATADYGNSVKILENALPLAKNPAEYVTVARMLGNFEFYRHDIDGGNKYFNLAEKVFDKFPNAEISPQEMAYAKAETEAYWASAAAAQKECDLAKQHFAEVSNFLAAFQITAQAALDPLAQFRQQFASMCP